MAERKFLQETNFQEEYDEDIIPERRAQDQIWRAAANAQRPKELNEKERLEQIRKFIE